MDERIREHAAVLVDWSAQIDAGDNVVVSVSEDAHELAVAVAEALGERDANMVVLYDSAEVSRAYLQGKTIDAATAESENSESEAEGDGSDTEAVEPAFDPDPAYETQLYEHTDSYLRLGGGRNTAAMADVAGQTQQAYRRSRQGIRDARLNTDWVSTVHPTRSLAQQAGMSFEAYQEFLYNAVLRDWEVLAEEMAQLKTLLDAGSEVHIETSNTDLWLSIENRTAVNSSTSVRHDSLDILLRLNAEESRG